MKFFMSLMMLVACVFMAYPVFAVDNLDMPLAVEGGQGIVETHITQPVALASVGEALLTVVLASAPDHLNVTNIKNTGTWKIDPIHGSSTKGGFQSVEIVRMIKFESKIHGKSAQATTPLTVF